MVQTDRAAWGPWGAAPPPPAPGPQHESWSLGSQNQEGEAEHYLQVGLLPDRQLGSPRDKGYSPGDPSPGTLDPTLEVGDGTLNFPYFIQLGCGTEGMEF